MLDRKRLCIVLKSIWRDYVGPPQEEICALLYAHRVDLNSMSERSGKACTSCQQDVSATRRGDEIINNSQIVNIIKDQEPTRHSYKPAFHSGKGTAQILDRKSTRLNSS